MYDIGRSKRATRAYSLDDIALIPSRRTRGTEMVNLEWRIDALTFDFPIMAAPMDSVMSPATAIEFGRLGGLGVLNLEGLWTRYEDPTPYLEELAGLSDDVATTRRMQEIYAEPIKAELITERMAEIRAAGVPVAGSLSPKNASRFSETVVNAGADFFVIRGTTVSAEHVANGDDVLDLRKFIYDLDVPVIVGGCATYQAALHLMRTGAAGVLVGFGGERPIPPARCWAFRCRWHLRSPTSLRRVVTTWMSRGDATSTSSLMVRWVVLVTLPRPSPAVLTLSWSVLR